MQPAAAQVNMHPPTTTQVGGHTSCATAQRDFGWRQAPASSRAQRDLHPQLWSERAAMALHNGHAGRFNNGFVGGWAYSIPYYYPVDNSAYGYDYVGDGGPDLYSGPPLGTYDPSLHIVAEQPPANPYRRRTSRAAGVRCAASQVAAGRQARRSHGTGLPQWPS